MACPPALHCKSNASAATRYLADRDSRSAFGGTKSPHGFFGMAMRRLEQVTVGRRTRAGSIERSNSDALDRCENNPAPQHVQQASSKLKVQSSRKTPNHNRQARPSTVLVCRSQFDR